MRQARPNTQAVSILPTCSWFEAILLTSSTTVPAAYLDQSEVSTGSRDQPSANHSSPRRRGRVRLVPVGVAVHARAAARQHRQLVQCPVKTQVLQQ